jgi:chromosome partitioning protein
VIWSLVHTKGGVGKTTTAMFLAAAAAINAAIDAADLVIIPTGPRAADIDRIWPTLDITQHRPTTILLTLVDMRKLEAIEVPRGLAEANAPVLRSIVRNLTVIDRSFGRDIPRFLGDYEDVFDELMTAARIEREAAKV